MNTKHSLHLIVVTHEYVVPQTTSNHEMTQKVHTIYCDFISIQVTKSFLEVYH
jgi:hypothetical protein